MADRCLVVETPELRVRRGDMAFHATGILGAIDVVFGECDR